MTKAEDIALKLAELVVKDKMDTEEFKELYNQLEEANQNETKHNRQ